MYIILYGLLLILYFSLRNIRDNNKSRKIYIITATLILSLISAIRHLAVGNDTYAYFMSYENATYLNWSDIFNNIQDYWHGAALKDPGFEIIEKGFTYISNDFIIYQFTIALLFISALGHLIYKNVHNLFGCFISYSFYLSLFYSYLPNSATRQTIAMGLLFWAIIIWVEKKQKILPLLIVLFASLIHKSVFLGFIPIILYYIHGSRLIYQYALVISCIVFIFGQPIAQYMAMASATERYMGYVQSEYYAEQAKPIAFIIEMLIFYLIGILKKGQNKESIQYKTLYKLNFALAICFISFIWVNPNLMRVIAYFSIWGIAFIPNALDQYLYPYKTLLYVIILALTVGRTVITPPPYKLYWQEMQLNERFN